MSKVKSISNVRKIVYACVFLAVIAIVATVVAVSTANQGVNLQAELPAKSEDSAKVSDKASDTGEVKPSDQAPTTSEKDDNNENATPTVKEVSFILPVDDGEVIKEYTEATVVFNKTLGVYTGHLALDIGGAENASVLAAFDGEVESITSGYLEGVTLTLNHGNGLKTVYNSIEVDENVNVGDKLAKGAVIGIISANNRQEYKDGAHLHFEVWENGVKISPFKYLTVNEK